MTTNELRAHRTALRLVPLKAQVAARGCLGIGLIVASETVDSWLAYGPNGVFLPDTTVRWAAVVDIPRAAFKVRTAFGSAHPMLHWATVRPTTIRYGMPMIARGTESFWRDLLAGSTSMYWPAPLRDPRLTRVFAAIEWAMTSTAMSRSGAWKAVAPTACRANGLPIERSRRPLLIFGDREAFDYLPDPNAWMPRACLAFPEAVGATLFDRVTRGAASGLLGAPPRYPEEFRNQVLASVAFGDPYSAVDDGTVEVTCRGLDNGLLRYEMKLHADNGVTHTVRFGPDCHIFAKTGRVVRGQLLATERFPLPSNWQQIPAAARWDALAMACGFHFNSYLRMWFNRRVLRLKPGFIHVDSRLASQAALALAVDSELFWDVGPALPYYRNDCDTFVFPSVPVEHWYHLQGKLPGDIVYDYRPDPAWFYDKPPVEEIRAARVEKRKLKPK